MASDLKMKISKTETIIRLSDRNDINRTQSQCHPPNLPSHQGQQTQEHTIHQGRKEAGDAPYISEWLGPGEWVKLNSNDVWLDLWYLKGFELRLACGERKPSLKGNIMNSGEKEVRHQERRSAWCRVRWSRGVLMQNGIEGRKSRPRSDDGDWGAPMQRRSPSMLSSAERGGR